MSGFDLVGKKFARLLVIELSYTHKKNGKYWKCLCNCGNFTTVSSHNLKQGSVLSCGCLNKERRKEWATNHNLSANLSGKKFGMLTVLKYFDKTKWECVCDCGNVVAVGRYDLINGKTKSCGCYKARRKPFGENAFNRIFYQYKKNAHVRNIPFNITEDKFKEITQQNCFYCGCEPDQGRNIKEGTNGAYVYNGIDRINPDKGYEVDNIVPCCQFCNVSKNNHELSYFINKIELIYDSLDKKGLLKKSFNEQKS